MNQPQTCSRPDFETQRVRRLFDGLASTYDREIALWERLFYRGCRGWVCAQAAGDVLEIAVGTGRNFPFYAPAVRLTGIELSEAMLARARRRARALKRRVDLRLGDAQALAFPDRSFDTVVFSIALCAIPDPRRALAEARRVLKPAGRLLLFEHARSNRRSVRLLQRFVATFSRRLGAHYLLRDPLDYLPGIGFEIEVLERLKLGMVQRIRARRRGSADNEGDAPCAVPPLPACPTKRPPASTLSRSCRDAKRGPDRSEADVFASNAKLPAARHNGFRFLETDGGAS